MALCVPLRHFDRLFVRTEALYRHAWTAGVAGINYLPCVCVRACLRASAPCVILCVVSKSGMKYWLPFVDRNDAD